MKYDLERLSLAANHFTAEGIATFMPCLKTISIVAGVLGRSQGTV
ncbi:MAG TPA: hypothetical protein PLO43_04475 [Chlamydiales bacterium]|nr:hypothetical protein [Chlamydiales bacterium]